MQGHSITQDKEILSAAPVHASFDPKEDIELQFDAYECGA